MDEVTTHFIRAFVSAKTMPTFEPSHGISDFKSVPLRATGITIYQLDRQGVPQSILAHWPNAR